MDFLSALNKSLNELAESRPPEPERPLLPATPADGGQFAEGMVLAARIRQLADEEGELTKRADALKADRRAAEAALLEFFANTGLKRFTYAGKTWAPRSQLWASAATSPGELTAALVAENLMELVSYSPQRLSSFVREALTKTGIDGFDGSVEAERSLPAGTLPEAVAAHVKIVEKFDVSMTKAE